MIDKLISFSLRKPKLVFFVTALAVLASIAAFLRVKVDTDPENMLPEKEFVRVFNHEVKKEFTIYGYIVLGVVNKRARQHEDTLIGALWAIGMSVGILFLYLTPGHQADLMSYLFGSILMVPRGSLYRLAALDAAVLITVFIFFRQFIALSFDEEHARVRGLPRTMLYIVLLGVVALTVVVLMQVVGLILVIALLTLPAATAALFSRSPAAIIGWATLIGAVSTFAGIYGSFTLDIPAGPAMVLVAGALYLAGLLLRTFGRGA